MIQKFNAPYDANGRRLFFPFWISDEYLTGKDPLFFQKNWLMETRNGVVDPKISEGVIEIARIAEKNKLSFEYLFGIAMNAALEKYDNESRQNKEELGDNFLDSNNLEMQNLSQNSGIDAIDNEDDDELFDDDFYEEDDDFDDDDDEEDDSDDEEDEEE
jgi:hypothetical protein